MKLILTSEGFHDNPHKILSEMARLTNKKVEEIKITLFSILYTDIHQYYLTKTVDLIESLRLDKQNIKTINICKECPQTALQDLDVMYMCGGNTFEVLYNLQKNGFIQYIKDFIQKGGVYLGHSAGSQILGPDIGIASAGSSGDIDEVGLKDTTGLGYIPYTIWTHYVDQDSDQIAGYQKNYKYDFLTLRDNEAIVIDGNHTNFIY